MTADLYYIRDGAPIVHQRVDGRLVPALLPYGLKIEGTQETGFFILEPANRSLTGLFTLPFVKDSRLDFVDLIIPSNGLFTQQDLVVLSNAGREVASWQTARSAVWTAGTQYGSPTDVTFSDFVRSWRELATCAHEASGLLRRWPSQLDRRLAWLPVEMQAGTEDVPLTEQEAESRQYVTGLGGQYSVTSSARWIGQERYLQSSTVSALAGAVITMARASLRTDDFDAITPMLNPIGAVAARARPPHATPDPDPSSWPASFLAFSASCLRAMAEITSASRGVGVLPLLDTDELYEAWLAIQVRSALDAQLGPRTANIGAFASWRVSGVLYSLWVKPAVSTTGRRVASTMLRPVVATQLIPDVVVTASYQGSDAIHIYDAKSWSVLLPDDALKESAKYLWGLRRTEGPITIPLITGVDLVTCAAQPALVEPDEALVHVTSATPSRGIQDLQQRIAATLETLTHSVTSTS